MIDKKFEIKIKIKWIREDQFHDFYGPFRKGKIYELPSDIAESYIRDGWAKFLSQKKIKIKKPLSLDEQIKKRIEESKKVYDRKAQRAELLKRNEIFLKELKGPNEEGFYCMSPEWQKFCRRWHIDPNWYGGLERLKDFVNVLPEILWRKNIDSSFVGPDPLAEIEFPDVEIDGGGHWDAVVLTHEESFLFLNINEWTTVDDIKSIWPKIMRLQREIYGDKKQNSANFARALCWFDLKKDFKLTYEKIVDFWTKYSGDKFDVLVETIKKTVQRMSRKIEKTTPIQFKLPS